MNTCAACGGRGTVRESMRYRGSYRNIHVTCHPCAGTGHITEPDPEPPAPMAAPAVRVILTITMANGTTRTRRPLEAQAPGRRHGRAPLRAGGTMDR
jgi:DnaJ-class molecular chaperone